MLSAKLTGGETVPFFPETVSVSLAPSAEGAVNEVDWGREPGFVFPQRSKNHADDPVYQIPTPVLLREDYVN